MNLAKKAIFCCWVAAAAFLSSTSKTQSLNQDYPTIMVVDMYTQGSTTPRLGNPFGREFVKNLGSKALTDFGLRQHLNLGVDVRLAYPKLINEISDLAQVKVYSSGSRASILSAISHNLGLLKRSENSRIQNAFSSHKFKPKWNAAELVNHKPVLTAFQKEQITIPLIVREKRRDRMFHPKI